MTNPTRTEDAVDRRTREVREAEQRAQRLRETDYQAAQRKSKEWCDWVDQRIAQGVNLSRESLLEAVGEALAVERDHHDRAIEATVAETKRAFETKLEALEQRLKAAAQAERQANNQQWTAIDQRISCLEKELDGRLGPSALHETKCAVESKLESKLDALEQRLKTMPGELPVAKTWRPETVIYQAELVSHEGALWQARKDTAQRPGGTDWICVARAGRDAVTPTVRGTYDVNESYKVLDIVVMDGASFIARKDDPGVCPGSGDWQLASKQGRPGRKGERGLPGPAGPKGDKGDPVMPELVNSKIDENYNLVVLRSDKSLEIIPLREAFERYDEETRP